MVAMASYNRFSARKDFSALASVRHSDQSNPVQTCKVAAHPRSERPAKYNKISSSQLSAATSAQVKP